MEVAPAEELGRPASDPVVTSLLAATQESKATAKWITAAFAVVGGALIAGLSLADLGGLSTCWLVLAVVGAALGMLGVLLIVVFATRVLASRFILLAELTRVGDPLHMSTRDLFHPSPAQKLQLRWVLDRLASNSSLPIEQGESIADFIGWLYRWEESQAKAQREALHAEAEFSAAEFTYDKAKKRFDELTEESPGSPEVAKVGKAVEAAKETFEELQRGLDHTKRRLIEAQTGAREFGVVAERLRATAQYEYVNVRFDTSRLWIFISGLMATAGVLLFAVATGAGAP